MTESLTTSIFITKARKIHGNKYDYSRINYRTAHTKVVIVCSQHGPFEQTPNNHIRGKGCAKCSGKYHLTTKEFIDSARLVHGNRYDYSPTIFKTQSSKVQITCPAHGLFEQRADHHLSGHGCIKCAGKDRYTTQEYIDKVKRVHNYRYDYSQVNYRNAYTKIIIVCPEHGPFEQAPSGHLEGRGCPKCGGSQKLNTSDFIAKARQVHGCRYDYSSVIYKNSQTKVKINCPEHGLFEQAPSHHLQGKGCRACSYKLRSQNQAMGTDQFIRRARSVNGNVYDYSSVKYVNSVTPVIIICSKHGAFRQLAHVHLRPSGCRKCSHITLPRFDGHLE